MTHGVAAKTRETPEQKSPRGFVAMAISLGAGLGRVAQPDTRRDQWQAPVPLSVNVSPVVAMNCQS
jgi:hypothetical protein